jgi:hypothetical protein
MRLTKVYQHFERPKIEKQDIDVHVRREILQSGITLSQGAQVAMPSGVVELPIST